MTSVYATNFVDPGLDPTHYLRVTKEGIPIQGQVASSYQTYTGTGNTTINYDGSDCLVIDSTLSAGDLTVSFSPLYNFFGRSCDIVVTRLLANDLILDFGTGQIIVPGDTSVLNSVTIPAAIGPVSGRIDFFSRTKAMFIKEVTPSVSNAIKALAFQWFVDASNELNEGTAVAVMWDTNNVTSVNQTDLALSGDGGDAANTCRYFTVVTEANYDISYDCFATGPLTTCLRTWISVNSNLYCFKECAFGLTGQSSGGHVNLHLVPGDIIAIYSGNAAGPDSGTVSFVPAVDYYGQVSITQFI